MHVLLHVSISFVLKRDPQQFFTFPHGLWSQQRACSVALGDVLCHLVEFSCKRIISGLHT